MVGTDQQVAVGDTVVTSGLGGVYPKGLPLGKVTSVERNSSQIYLEIGVSAFASATSNEEVLVVTSLTDEQKATADEVSQANAQDSAQEPQAAAATEAAADEAGQTDEAEAAEQDGEGGAQR
jgi:rod shape-determining protein MreC